MIIIEENRIVILPFLFQGREAFSWFTEAMVDHNELFWYQFSVEMDNVLDVQPSDSWDSFPLFQLLNDFFNASSE